MAQRPTQPPYRCFIGTDQTAYHPGDKINCKIELSLDRKFNCEEIYAVFTGEARAYWIDKQPSSTAVCTHQPYFQKRALFESQRHKIWSSNLIEVEKRQTSSLHDIVRFSSPNTIKTNNMKTGEKKPEFRGLEPGKHELPVQFELPEEGIHSSLEIDEELATVRYQVEIECLYEGRITKKFHQLLHVFAPRDLSEEADKLQQPAMSEKKWEAKSGKVHATLTLPKTGYTPGEPLNAQVIVHNMSSSSIKFASVSIVKKITAIADKPTYDFRERDIETSGSILPFPKILKGERKEWIASIYVPALQPNLCLEDFIHLNYFAKLSVGFERGSFKHAFLHTTIPITIGTVAIDGAPAGAVPVKVPEKMPLGFEQNEAYLESQLRHRLSGLSLTPTDYSGAPPSYDEAMATTSPLLPYPADRL